MAEAAPEDLSQILLLLRTQTKRDFRGYRKRMLMRRIARRMALRHVDRIADYVEFLRTHPDEVQRARQGPVDRRDRVLPRAGAPFRCSNES